MCLVSFVPLSDRIVITSSRDESTGRKNPTLIHEWIRTKKSLTFPQDVKGGTWIGYDNFNNFLVILNGGRTKHKRAKAYRKSRGLIVLDLLDADNIPLEWEKIDLTDIEPFTLLHYSSEGNLWEWIWNGKNKTTNKLDEKKGHCWLSSTLYTPEEWTTMVDKFQKILPTLKTSEIIRSFHLEHRYENKPAGIIHPIINTVSNTVVEISEEKINFNYLDLR